MGRFPLQHVHREAQGGRRVGNQYLKFILTRQMIRLHYVNRVAMMERWPGGLLVPNWCQAASIDGYTENIRTNYITMIVIWQVLRKAQAERGGGAVIYR